MTTGIPRMSEMVDTLASISKVQPLLTDEIDDVISGLNGVEKDNEKEIEEALSATKEYFLDAHDIQL